VADRSASGREGASGRAPPAAPAGRPRARTAAVAGLVGVTAGCWVGYVLVYPVSSLALPRYTVAGVVVLGVYLDRVAGSMAQRLGAVLGAGAVAFATGWTVYALPALVGWFDTPAVQQAIYLRGLRRGFLFALLALTLLFLGTFCSYVGRNVYAEATR